MTKQSRIRRFFFVALTTATVLTLLLWARAAFAYLHFSHVFHDGYVSIYLGSEGYSFQWQKRMSQWAASQNTLRHYATRLPARAFSMEFWYSPAAFTRIDLSMHFGVLLFLLGGYPTYILVSRRIRVRQRTRRNQCFECAYNLVGNTSGVCPECGTMVPRSDAPS